jgi:DNA recombination protein RmuC
MIEALLILSLMNLFAALGIGLWLWLGPKPGPGLDAARLWDELRRLEEANRAEAARGREELARELAGNRRESGEVFEKLRSSLGDGQARLGQSVQERLDQFARLEREQAIALDTRLAAMQESAQLAQQKIAETLNAKLLELQTQNEKSSAGVREAVDSRLKELQAQNEQKLEQMRATVDEKLHKTLEDRLGQSFELVSKRLTEVQQGLGALQGLAQDVNGLKRALTNVKTRGVLGEAQLGALLEQFLASEQYAANVKIRPRSPEVVEYAVKLPGTEEGGHVWLPIDAKFPIEDYQRLMEAYEVGDLVAVETHAAALEVRLKSQARDIRDKYISPPASTDFALMFLPFEGLYAEALRRPGLFEWLQRECRVTLVGPTTLTAFLNSLQVGFKTLAITKQSGEVWKVLGAVKTEFGRFGEALEKVHKSLDEASDRLGKVSERSRQMEKKLTKVQALPGAEATALIGEETVDPE